MDIRSIVGFGGLIAGGVCRNEGGYCEGMEVRRIGAHEKMAQGVSPGGAGQHMAT